jgi:hypothetical protein
MNLSNMHVFPLVKMDQYMDGYFMDQAGNVYSNKTSRNGTLTKMGGSRTPSGTYYTLNKRTHRSDDLYARAKRHPAFAVEVNPSAVAVAKAVMSQGGLPVALPANKAKSAAKLVEVKGYVLATVGPTDRLVFGTDPVFQLDEVTATTEAQRIAMLKPGTRVVLLKAVKSVVAGGVKWD